MFNLVKTKSAALFALLVGSVMLPMIASAQDPAPTIELPTESVTTLVSDVQTFVLAIGGAVLLLIFAMKALRWARRAG